MLSLLCLALCIAAASAQGCCGPDRWEGYMEASVGFAWPGETPNALMERASLHYDKTGNRFAAFLEKYNEVEERRYEVRILENFNTMRRMEVEEGACTITELTNEMNGPCISDDAKFIHSFYVGISGESLEIDSFELPMERPSDSYHIRVNKDCMPFSMKKIEVAQNPESDSSYAKFVTYSGVREGIEDESVFETPPECQHVDVNPKVLKKHDEMDIISAFFHKL